MHMHMGWKCLRKRNKLDSVCYFHSILFNFCIDCTYLSVNRINAIGEKSRISQINFGQNFIVRHLFRTTCFSSVCYELVIRANNFIQRQFKQ